MLRLVLHVLGYLHIKFTTGIWLLRPQMYLVMVIKNIERDIQYLMNACMSFQHAVLNLTLI